jgi:hypothetical protein
MKKKKQDDGDARLDYTASRRHSFVLVLRYALSE